MVHPHPERNIPASRMNTDGAILLAKAICRGMSDGWRKAFARSVGLDPR